MGALPSADGHDGKFLDGTVDVGGSRERAAVLFLLSHTYISIIYSVVACFYKTDFIW